MPRYIDVNEQLVRLDNLSLECKDVIIEFLRTAKPADAILRRKGAWAFRELNDFVHKYECSVCGECHRKKFPHCPSCGAFMENGENGDV